MKTLASNFKGPAHLCAYRNDKGLMVVVPISPNARCD